jgi:polysaccharide chain length determinant protein (PEP-CTERM system associated)
MVATERRAELSRQIRGNRSTVTGSGTAAAAPSDVALRIAETQKRLDELLLKYTDKHPDVIALRETLQQLEARQAEEHADRTRGRSSPGLMDGLSSDPVYQQIQLQISQVDAEIATLRGEVGLHQRLVAQLRTAVDSASEADAEFARLTRNNDTTKARYDELVTSHDRARLAEGAQQAGAVRFEIIDPPTLRMEPVAPNRPQLLVIVLFAGLLAGAGTAFAAHRTKPVFTGVRSLADVTGVPVLGSVSRAWFERHQFQRRSEWLRLGAATGGLVAVFALVMILADAGARLLHTIAGWA